MLLCCEVHGDRTTGCMKRFMTPSRHWLQHLGGSVTSAQRELTGSERDAGASQLATILNELEVNDSFVLDWCCV